MAQFGEDKTSVRFVPWFSMSEWDQVYKQIFSDDTMAQVKGYERLLLWKARCPMGIPAGAQCTLDLVQICLKDREIWPQIASGLLPPYHEHELRIMYSMAILRFLNNITAVIKSKTESMYYLARKLHIPDWIVNIRHDTSHGENLPTLTILREATHFCLDWIHEHYWKVEAEATAEWTVQVDTSKFNTNINNLKEVLEVWEAIMLYSSAGLKTISEIPDNELQEHILEEKAKYSEHEIELLKKTLELVGCEFKETEMAEVQLIILKELQRYFEICSKFANGNKFLIDVLLQGDGFLPSSDFLLVFNTELDSQRMTENRLPVIFLDLWGILLCSFEQKHLIPLLVERLIYVSDNENESCHRRKMAALWMKELSLGLTKAKKTEELRIKYKSDKIRPKGVSKRTMNKHTKTQHALKQIVGERNSDLMNVVPLRLHEVPSKISMKLLKRLVQKPNNMTSIFLPSLMDLLEPALPIEIQEKLITLVNIYTRQLSLPATTQIEGVSNHMVHNLTHNDGDPIHTVDNLTGFSNHAQNGFVTESMSQTVPAFVSHWFHDKEYTDWSKYPLGILPSQKDESMLQLDLPCDTVWQPTKQLDNYSIAEKNLPGFFQEKINWEEVIAKRPKRAKSAYKKRSHYSHVVEKAFDLIKNKD